jgi:hypothetical protein
VFVCGSIILTNSTQQNSSSRKLSRRIWSLCSAHIRLNLKRLDFCFSYSSRDWIFVFPILRESTCLVNATFLCEKSTAETFQPTASQAEAWTCPAKFVHHDRYSPADLGRGPSRSDSNWLNVNSTLLSIWLSRRRATGRYCRARRRPCT